MSKYTRIILAMFILAVSLRVSPIPRQSESCPVDCIVTTFPSWEVAYAEEDGSFMFLFFAGCLPWKSCAINEPTDWWIGGY